MKSLYGREIPFEKTGESWDISCRPNDNTISVIENGPDKGKSLAEWFAGDRNGTLGTWTANEKSFPLLVKIIDAQDNLSVQVHPGDAYARDYGELGKSEMWYILEAPEDGSLIIGLNGGVTRGDLRRACETGEGVENCLYRLPVKRGDMINIPAGLVHALTRGVMVAEIQQNSDITYRLYDYNRPGLDGKPRPLHIEHSLNVADFENVLPKEVVKGNNISSPYFNAIKYEVTAPVKEVSDPETFALFTCVEGACSVEANGIVTEVPVSRTVFVPAGVGAYTISGNGVLLKSYVPGRGTIFIPPGYRAILSSYETQTAIGRLRRTFEDKLSAALNLSRVSAPLFVEPSTGYNDDLSGTERAVDFDIPAAGRKAHIVHSLAKWKRAALHHYGFPVGEGMYTDMNAIRRDDVLDNIHSVYVDQWDWEKIIRPEERTSGFLEETVKAIVCAICDTQEEIKAKYPALTSSVCREVAFVTAQELEDMYPSLAPDRREQEFARSHKTICVTQIGGRMRSGERHGHRAPDYDDWTLNADIIIWSEVLQSAVEISSMGIRVDAATLDRQLTESGHNERRELLFHRTLLSGGFPLTVGGGIGQSRLCMLILEKAHIGEVQVSVWDDETVNVCRAAGVELL